jgi:hypothetical protein
MSITFGEPYIFQPLFIPPFSTPVYNKFFDYIYPTTKWYQYSNQPLARSIISFANKLIYDKTSKNGGIKEYYEKGEPRLLLIAADVETATTEVFDSYNCNNNADDHLITIDHVLASAAIPKNFPYVEINGRKYGDGGILSNTPVRELVHKYDDFWVTILGLDSDNSANSKSNNKLSDDAVLELYKIITQKRIPNLELSVVNLHPSEEKDEQIPSLYDYDMTKDRENDIRFHDKTEYDIRMTQFVSDYHELAVSLLNLVIDSMKVKKDIGNKIDDSNDSITQLKDLLNRAQRTFSHKGKPRYYYDLLKKQFDVEEVIKVQRKDDKHTISDKIFDFSSITISNLIREGEKDTLNELMKNEIENKGNNTASDALEKFIQDIKNEKIESEENQYIIQLAEEKLTEIRQSK